ncbi:GNAT family N-acetyltransferase [Chitinimonas naiadis]
MTIALSYPVEAVVIRPLVREDAESFMLLRLALAAESELAMGCTLEEEVARPMERFYDNLSAGPLATIFGAFVHDRLVGTAAVMVGGELVSYAHKYLLWGVIVSPAYRRRAIARRLIETAIDHARAQGALHLNLCVFEPNYPARQLYDALGFQPYGREPGALCLHGQYYDACLMNLRLAA